MKIGRLGSCICEANMIFNVPSGVPLVLAIEIRKSVGNIFHLVPLVYENFFSF